VGLKVGVGTVLVFVLVTLLQADAWRRAIGKSKAQFCVHGGADLPEVIHYCRNIPIVSEMACLRQSTVTSVNGYVSQRRRKETELRHFVNVLL
jgi:hypothetical protein